MGVTDFGRKRVTPMLTDTEIRKAKPGPKPRKLTDARGLFLLLTPARGRWWRLKYRFAGKEKLLSLGVYPDEPLKAAREKAEDARRQVAAGTDPSAARQAEKRAVREAAENDFESVAREWLENVKGQWAPQHHADSLRRFEVRIFPRIGHRPIRDITAPELLSALRAIEARGTIESTHKVARACGQVFRFAIAAGRCDRNKSFTI